MKLHFVQRQHAHWHAVNSTDNDLPHLHICLLSLFVVYVDWFCHQGTGCQNDLKKRFTVEVRRVNTAWDLVPVICFAVTL